jgi:hypothetical protein
MCILVNIVLPSYLLFSLHMNPLFIIEHRFVGYNTIIMLFIITALYLACFIKIVIVVSFALSCAVRDINNLVSYYGRC